MKLQKLKFIFILSTFISFSQEVKISYNLDDINPKDYPFFQNMIETIDGKIKYKKQFSYIDSLKFSSLNYKSFDKLNIGGFVIEPKKKGIYPVLIYNRGGNADYGTVKFAFLANFLAKIANKGYIIIGSQLRGSSVSEGQDEFGGKDVEDALDIIKIIDELPNVDKNRIGAFGWSRGVMTNFLMLKKTNRIKTNIAIAGPSDLAKTNRKEMFGVYKERIPNYTKDSIAALKSRSSIIAIDSIQNKNLTNFIIHGNKDTSVDVEHAFDFYKKLNEKNYTTKLLIYENEEHSLSNVTDNLLDQIENWLKRYL